MARFLKSVSKPSSIRAVFADLDAREQLRMIIKVIASEETKALVKKCDTMETAHVKLGNEYSSVLKDVQRLRNEIRADSNQGASSSNGTPLRLSVAKSLQRKLMMVLALPSIHTMMDLVTLLKVFGFESDVITQRAEAANVLRRVMHHAPAKWNLNGLRKEVVSIFDKHFRQASKSFWAQCNGLGQDVQGTYLSWGVTAGGDSTYAQLMKGNVSKGTSELSDIGQPRAQSSSVAMPHTSPAASIIDLETDSESSDSSDSSSSESDSSSSDDDGEEEISVENQGRNNFDWNAPIVFQEDGPGGQSSSSNNPPQPQPPQIPDLPAPQLLDTADNTSDLIKAILGE